MSLIKKLAGQTAIYGLSTIVGRLLNYLLVPIYTRVFIPEEFGKVTELYAYAGFFTVLFTYGMETAFFRFSEKNNHRPQVFSTAFLSILFSTIVLAGALVLFAPGWADILRYESNPEYIIWFALILGMDALTAIPFAALRQENKATLFALLKLINIGINIGLNVFFLILCPKFSQQFVWMESIYNPAIGIGYIFISNLAASGITLLLLLPVILKKLFAFDTALWKQMMKYALPLLVVGFAGIINEMLDRILLKWMLPFDYDENMRLLGIYGANYKLSILIALFTQAYRYAAEPLFFSQASSHDSPQLFARMMRYFALVQGIFFLVIMLYLDFFKNFIGAAYHEGLAVVPVLLMANIVLGIYYNVSVWYKLTDKTMSGAYISVFGAAITIVLNLLLIPVFGYMGSAWATLLCYIAMLLVSWHLGQKHYPIAYEWRKIIAYLSAAVLLYFFASLTESTFALDSPLMFFVRTLLLLMYFLWLWKMERRERHGN